MNFELNWIKQEMTCACGNKFKPHYRNGILTTKLCPNCQFKKLVTRSSDFLSRKGKSVAEAKKRAKTTPWKDKELNDLIQCVQLRFCNPYIRARDQYNFGVCISCNSGITQAGHRFAVGSHSAMRFMVNNIHGQEISCNHFKSGNPDEFDKGLINRHGKEYLDNLKYAEQFSNASNFKWDRFNVIAIGETYKFLLKESIWIFNQKEFNDYKEALLK